MGIVARMPRTSSPGQSHLQTDAGAASWGWGAYFPLGKEYSAVDQSMAFGIRFLFESWHGHDLGAWKVSLT